MEERLDEWQFFYNWHRPHGSLMGKSPIDKVCDLLARTPYWKDVYNDYDSIREGIQEQNYQLEMRLRKLKRSL